MVGRVERLEAEITLSVTLLANERERLASSSNVFCASMIRRPALPHWKAAGVANALVSKERCGVRWSIGGFGLARASGRCGVVLPTFSRSKL